MGRKKTTKNTFKLKGQKSGLIGSVPSIDVVAPKVQMWVGFSSFFAIFFWIIAEFLTYRYPDPQRPNLKAGLVRDLTDTNIGSMQKLLHQFPMKVPKIRHLKKAPKPQSYNIFRPVQKSSKKQKRKKKQK